MRDLVHRLPSLTIVQSVRGLGLSPAPHGPLLLLQPLLLHVGLVPAAGLSLHISPSKLLCFLFFISLHLCSVLSALCSSPSVPSFPTLSSSLSSSFCSTYLPLALSFLSHTSLSLSLSLEVVFYGGRVTYISLSLSLS